MLKIFLIIALMSSSFSTAFASEPGVETMNVPPKEEWTSCAADSECVVRISDCGGFGSDVAYNKKYIESYNIEFKKVCSQKPANGDATIALNRGDARNPAKCVNLRCAVVPPEPVKKESPSALQRFKTWISEVF